MADALIAAFTFNFEKLTRAIITDISLSVPKGDHYKPLKGLWDTGATDCVVTKSTASSMGLVPTGKVRVQHAGGITENNSYLIDLHLDSRVMIPGVTVYECEDNSDFGVIIGMDVITLGDFSISNLDRKTVMSFRIPSIEVTDYVKSRKIKDINSGKGFRQPSKKKR